MSDHNGNGSIAIILIDSDHKTRTTARGYLAGQGVRVSAEADNLASGMHLIRGLRPQIVMLELLDRPGESLEAIRRIKDDYPNLGIIVSSPDSSSNLILQCVRAGAQEFLTRPVNIPELGEAVTRLGKLIHKTGSLGHKSGEVIAVSSNKGGVGVSCLATNLGVALSRLPDKTAALLDLEVQGGTLGTMLDLRPGYSLVDAVMSVPLDEGKLRTMMTPYDDRLALLPLPDDLAAADKVSPVQVIEVLSLLRQMYDHVVVDVGDTLDGRVLEVLNIADLVISLTSLDVPTVRNAAAGLGMLQEMGIPREKILLVVNRFDKKARVGLKDVESTTGHEVFWTIPNDFKVMHAALDSGSPAVLKAPKSKLARNLCDLAGEIARLRPGLVAAPESQED